MHDYIITYDSHLITIIKKFFINKILIYFLSQIQTKCLSNFILNTCQNWSFNQIYLYK